MFGFFKAEFPVGDDEKKWIEDSLSWLYSPARKIKFKNFEFISTTNYFPSENLKIEEVLVYKIFEKVKTHLLLPDDLKCEVRLIDPDTIPLPEGLHIKPSNSDPMSFNGYMEDGKFIIDVNSKYLSTPFYIVSKIAYSLTFYKLINDESLKKVNGFINELSTLAFGFGVFQANSVIYHDQWQGTSHYGWKVGRRGFLSQEIVGYALALSAFIKEDLNQEWSKYLCRDVKAYFDRSVKYIKSNSDFYSEYKNKMMSNSDVLSLSPDYLYCKMEHYKSGKLRSESEMKNGVKDGITRYFYENGNVWAEWEYLDGMLWNVLFNHSSSGVPMEKGSIKDGTGTAYSYHENGELNFIQEFKDGVPVDLKMMQQEEL
jgi:hypothetical protein